MRDLHRYLAVAVALLLMVGGAQLMEELAVSRVHAAGDEAGVAAANGAVRHVEARLTGLERELLDRAQRIARVPAVRRALIDQDPTAAIVAFDGLTLPDGYSAEVYTPLPEPIAWAGPVLPLDPSTRRLAFLDTTQSAIFQDGGFRTAMAVWLPVREGNRVVGAVRVTRLLRVQVPVRNQYLRDFDLLDQWMRGLVPSVEVTFGEPGSTEVASIATRRVRSLDGFLLAHLSAPPPTTEALVRAVRAEYGNGRSFLLVLFGGWVVFGLALVARGALIRPLKNGGAVTNARAIAAGFAFLGGLWALRYVLLAVGMPSRLSTAFPTPPAFDPAFLGSGLGGGLAGSAVELCITALFGVFTGLALFYGGLRLASHRRFRTRIAGPPRVTAGYVVALLGLCAAGVLILVGAGGLVHRATEDATLGYFDRTGPLPEGLVLMAFGAFLLIILSAVLSMTGLALMAGVHGRRQGASALGAAALALVGGYVFGAGAVLPLAVAIVVVALVGTVARWLSVEPARWTAALSMRGALLSALVLTAITYPIVSAALSTKEEARLRDAIEDFADGEDPRVAFALESVLLDARNAEMVRQTFKRAADGLPVPEGIADSLAADLVTGSLLAALADYRVGLALHGPAGEILGRYIEEMPRRSFADEVLAAPAPPDPYAFNRLRRLYEAEADFAGFVVERRPAGERGSKFRYGGIGPVRAEEPDAQTIGWITARAEPRPARYVAETPFPRVLVPAGLYRLSDEEWVFAEFLDGVLHRSRGADFGRFRLPPPANALPVGETLWQTEQLERQPVRMFYQRLTPERVIAARIPATTVFDHLYFILRILSPGLLLAALAYLIGVMIRRNHGAQSQRPRLRDRVLNRFLLVGLIAVVATGLIGRSVIVTQNREAVEERLKRQLARVEALLYEEAVGDAEGMVIPPERILDRARLDLVGPRLGLDVNLYRGAELVASSRSQLVRQRLIEPRLPIDVTRALFVDGERYAFATGEIGRFEYTIGYEAIPDAAGRPAVVLGVPTLPEQFAIEADQARMIAYLFGVLLLLLMVIFVIATFLANRLTRPFRRLREGLRAVGAGESPSEPIPVESRDEVGEVIETFNAVWDQLEESRRKLATHEREAAWREMARQVAHEIKNPLTPMRLSVQHLRRAYERAEAEEGGADGRFGTLLDSISGTLIEQIDALNRIAGEFSRFGRMPERDLEVLDVNEVMRQAAALVGEEPRAEIVLDLAPEPLHVRADREELRRVYINLLKNAQQAIPDGERGMITVSSMRRAHDDADDQAWAETLVRDTGMGIPPDIQPRVFQPNFSTKTSGMGLGLAIARKTIEDMNGEITFETQPGVGTAFSIRLPLVDPGEV